MSKINVLPKNIAELIAAGEVVERPASVVKETLENSIDAGATSITVEIKNGGITYIRITDDGSGIEKEDIEKAFLSHATSKISTADDLNAIFTLGFRGEALASIAAVSKVEVLSRVEGEDIGSHLIIEGGEKVMHDDAGCPVGTTLIVRDIFYNVPARMKFLKRDVTEANYIADIVDKVALSHPEISFRFIRDGKQELLTPGDGNLYNTVYALFGKEFASGLLEAKYSNDGFEIDGFVSKPEKSRPNRNMQFFFLNGR
ncbi:MAG TPA: DNA mismatch repair endonuclease MutL, partial [Oscillospiraceae bacterium]|nr:DNA mismatch repair endonuclease MutL [Oscillospiraceae bacterium]